MADTREKTEGLLRPGETCWRVERAGRFALIVDAAEYFALAKSAMLEARHAIMLVGWDFDLRIKLTPGGDGAGDEGELGPFLLSILERRPELRIYILKWDMAVVYTLAGQMIPLAAFGWRAPKRLHLRLDSSHPWTSAHHQKIVVIDDSLAFCGGIDMTGQRWDTREHRPGHPLRLNPDGSPYCPWHDATVAVDREVASCLGAWARQRWQYATGRTLPAPPRNRDLWPANLEPQFTGVEVGIARTMPTYGGREGIREIESLYLAAIASARKSIYLESQYFASLRICEAIAKRLQEEDGPEVVVINPQETEGWLEEEVMGAARAVCLRRIAKADRHGRFGFFTPVNEVGEPIYVHAKILVVDDRFLRVGSSNVNNRSLGFDSECDLAVEATSREEAATIERIRNDLLAEHLGTAPDKVAAAIASRGSLLAAIEHLARPQGRSLRRLPRREPTELEEALVLSRLADPERPQRIHNRVTHVAKQAFLMMRPSAVSAAVGVLAGFALALALRRRWRAGTRGA